MPQTCTWAGAVRVVMPRGACGNGCLLLILWSRWRCRSVVTRAVAITVRARWWAAARAGAGSEAVAVPARTVAIRMRRAVVNDRCRAATGWPVRGPLRNGCGDGGGGAGGGVDEFGGDDPGGVLLADQLGVV